MKKMPSVILLAVLTLMLVLTACGGVGSDALKGTWTREDADYGTVTLVFDGNGKIDFSYSALDYKDSGSYTITDSNVSVKLDNWDNAAECTFSTEENALNLVDPMGSVLNGEYTKK
jgi:hypothetical protein